MQDKSDAKKMMPASATLSLKALIKGLVNRYDQSLIDGIYRRSSSDSVFLGNRSVVFLNIIISFLYDHYNRPVSIVLPGYFCADTIKVLDHKKVQLHYYRITEQLTPDWHHCETIVKQEGVDIFLLVHYFGVVSDGKKSKEFCNNNNILFLEDCAHMLCPGDKIGRNGDIVFYSPYKQLPFGYLSVLVVNTNRCQKKIDNGLVGCLQKEFADGFNKRWLTRRDLLFLAKRLVLHYFPRLRPRYKNYTAPSLGLNVSNTVSLLSIKLLCSFLRKKNAVNVRHKSQCQLYDNILKPHLQHIGKSGGAMSFAALYQFNNDSLITAQLNSMIPLFQWNNIPLEIKRSPEYPIANRMAKNCYYVPVNGVNNGNKMVSRKNIKRISEQFFSEGLSPVQSREVGECQFYKMTQNMCNFLPLTQSSHYLYYKKSSRWRVRYYSIGHDDEVYAVCGVLVKRLFGCITIIRVNSGPIFYDDYSLAQRYCLLRSLVLALKKQFGFSFVFSRFSLKNNQMNKSILKSLYFFRYNKECYQTSIIDFSGDIEGIFSQLNGKWRNQYRLAVKQGLGLKVSYNKEAKKLFFTKYLSFQKQKGFDTWTVESLNEFDKSFSEKVVIFTAMKSDSVIAQIAIALHGLSATYLLSWQDNMGRKSMANNFLLWSVVEYLHEKGFKYFDLGGLDDEFTPHIAKFKRGMNGKDIRYVGNYVKLLW
jgi:lipid II:glycine glycyltransferase (peptidoglycan interpeptide bridge formation enzyme)/dTDP-4-amino-4,6-dideoxygalactose transaminase